VKFFVVDPHAMYRRGLVAFLESLPAVESVGDAGSIRAAWADDRLLRADLVIVDPAGEPCDDLIAELPAPVMVYSSDCAEVLGAMQAGAAGYVSKDRLEPEMLGAAVAAAASVPGTSLTEREQRVLALIAAGHQTREVAQQLCYSERTVKNVLHDVVTKLHARSRSQAVACAVREGLI
jgi:DNA-binding NarL/FixJ family response regulator